MNRIMAPSAPLKTVAYAKLINLTSPAAEFIGALSPKDQARQRLVDLLAEQGRIANPQHRADRGDGLWELKSYQIRIPFLHSKPLTTSPLTKRSAKNETESS